MNNIAKRIVEQQMGLVTLSPINADAFVTFPELIKQDLQANHADLTSEIFKSFNFLWFIGRLHVYLQRTVFDQNRKHIGSILLGSFEELKEIFPEVYNEAPSIGLPIPQTEVLKLINGLNSEETKSFITGYKENLYKQTESEDLFNHTMFVMIYYSLEVLVINPSTADIEIASKVINEMLDIINLQRGKK